MATTSNVLRIDLTLDENKLEEGALKLFETVKPGWNQKDIKFKVFTDGISNKLIGGYLPEDKNTMALVRVYGKKTELLIDREAEIKTFVLLHKAGCGPQLYAACNNGLCYEYLPGIILDTKMVREERIFRLVVKEMVKMHSIKPQEGAVPPPCLFKTMERYLSILPEKFEDAKKQERYVRGIVPQSQLHEEVSQLKSALLCLETPVVFCHNDALLGNIVFNETEGTLKFIDYEYASFNYQAFDIANHFAEFAGVEVVDYSLYPDKDLQLKWLRAFLGAWREAQNIPDEVTERDLEVLYVKVNKFVLAAHLFWGIWGLIQSHNSTIDFDFLDYAKLRFDEYFTRKDGFLALQLPE
ncbi:ethanolamine kinase 1-like [Asterias amurensis]|uniref:ethanolamine kinase 1-like n=1 Tax=Asterias amurensis TaxID=7602 RepID=UPI003AB3E44E